MQTPSIKEMIKVGAHFGHTKDKTCPQAKKEFCFGIKDGIYIIDLEKTKKMLNSALEYLVAAKKSGKTILLVGTKRQAQDIIKKVAEETQAPYVSNRWLGGMVTNFGTVRAGIKKLNDFEKIKETPEYEEMTKQEQVKFNKNLEKLEKDLGGIRKLDKMPDIFFVVDVVEENVAVAEAKKKNIPIVGICDTNANPNGIDYCIPANTKSKPTIEMIVKLVGEAIK